MTVLWELTASECRPQKLLVGDFPHELEVDETEEDVPKRKNRTKARVGGRGRSRVPKRAGLARNLPLICRRNFSISFALDFPTKQPFRLDPEPQLTLGPPLLFTTLIRSHRGFFLSSFGKSNEKIIKC